MNSSTDDKLSYNIKLLLTGIENLEHMTILQVLNLPVRNLRGIGEKYGKVLNSAGITKIKDLVEVKDIVSIPNKLLFKWQIAAKMIYNAKYGVSGGRIIFSGLSKAGKTSIVYVLKSITKTPEVTTGINQETIKLAGNVIQIADMGGQAKFRDIYLMSPGVYFPKAKLVFYVIDIQERDIINESIEYLDRVLAIFKYLKNHPFISIFLHKYDPDLAYTLKYDAPEIEEKIDKLFQKHQKFKYSKFRTSIFNPTSIFLAIASTLSRVFPVMSILSDLLQDFAELHGFDGMVLMDENGMLIGQYLPETNTDAIISHSYGIYNEVKEESEKSFTPILKRKQVEHPPGEIIIQQIYLPHNNGYIIYWTKADNLLDLSEYLLSEITRTLNPWLYNLLSA